MILVVLRLIGLVAPIAGGLISILLVIAIIVAAHNFLSGRRDISW